MKYLRRFADDQKNNSLANRFRRERFAWFRSMLGTVARPCRILDVGGTELFWEQMGFIDETDVEVVLLNLSSVRVSRANFTSVAGDARDMRQFREQEFDVVFSNSVIEHVGDFDRQLKMAGEIMRVGKRYFVQTPNKHFPIEPHFLFPYFQFLPVRVRVFLVRHFSLGWVDRTPDREAAGVLVRSVRLPSASEMKKLFPQSTLYREKVLGLTKSFVAYGGWYTP
ncbi:MAG: class I SAM-dependent methyltransferase [Bacteroidota bacterium]|jgi:SAM-dependent methyltransferase